MTESPTRPADTDGPRMLFGLRLMAVLEIVLFLGIALVLDATMFDGDRFADIRPHPFWAIVILVAVQYGANEGLAAAIAASLAFLIGNIPAPTLGTDVFDYWTEIALRPALWVGVGQILGLMRNRQLVERARLREQVAELHRQNSLITEGFDELKKAKAALEARIARQFRTVITTYRAAQSIDVTDPEKLEQGLDRLIEAVLSPRKYSLWRLRPEGLVLERSVGWEAGDRYDRELDLSHPMVQHLLSRQPALCAARADDERKLMGQGLLAGALADMDTGEIVGMLKVEDTAFIDFSIYTLENFNVICSWIGSAHVKARQWEAIQDDRVTGMNTLLMTAEVFERITDLLTHLGRRRGFESTILSVRIGDGQEWSPEHRSVFALAVGEATRSTFRSSDLAFEREREDDGFAILLPGTPLEDATALREKFRAAVAARLPETVPADQVEIEASRIEPGRQPA